MCSGGLIFLIFLSEDVMSKYLKPEIAIRRLNRGSRI